MKPMELFPAYYVVPFIMAAVLAIFPTYLERKVKVLEKEKEQLANARRTHANSKRVSGKNSKLDTLTGALRKDAFNEIFGLKIMEAKHMNQPLSLIIFDIDYFKKINDTYGHLTGDKILKEIGEVVRRNIRQSEYFVRWGGEEFIVLMPNTGLQGAKMVAEKLRRAVESNDFSDVGKVTCSFGVTQLFTEDTITSFLQRADEALYEAKKEGRNRVKVKI
jgi:diguanylate cyclase (GGDEF)-like protein